MRWKVGEGRNIRIFTDRWCLNAGNEILKGKGGDKDQNARVERLISEDGTWDTEAINNWFHVHEASAILNTPIREHGPMDERYWAYEQSGAFSVKSAYLLQLGHYTEHEHVSNEDVKWWNNLVWTLAIPPKARIFMWRAFTNTIPTAANLKAHHTPTAGICDRCNNRWDSTVHALIFCPTLRPIWKASSFWKLIKNGDMSELHVLADAVRRSYGKDKYEVWCLMLWKSWQYVCSIRHGQGGVRDSISEDVCSVVWEEFQTVMKAYNHPTSIGFKCGEHRWSAPCRGSYRVDVDASFNTHSNIYGVGVIIRDWNGAIMVALSRPTAARSSVMLAEILAVVEGIKLSIQHHFSPIEIFTDSTLAATLMAEASDREELLPDDVREILVAARSSMLIGVSHMRRTANRAAHGLAQLVRLEGREMVWLNSFPSWLVDIAHSDFMQ